MPLGVREVLLVMRARDEASRVVMGVGRSFGQAGTASATAAKNMLVAGGALTAAGIGMAGAGALILAGFNKAADSAIEYRQQAALTKTQTDGLGASIQELEQIGLRVARAIPAPLEELQPALFDIFSSMDVGIKQAERLLVGFAKASVAGQTDVQTAGRATIALMNAFKIPVSGLSEVLDFQFQLVRKGVGTYEEFASTIGRAIPSTVRAGQTYETLGGMLAFLTRNGLSTSMAASSAARALDAMANPKVTERLETMGIKARDASGEFRPLVAVVGDLSDRLATMTKPERAAALHALFLGAGGTIQARRFFDLAVNNFAEFEKMVQAMGASAGEMEKAYDIMFNQPQSQIQLMTNRLKAMEIEVGQGLIPVKLKLLQVGASLLGMWNDLPEPVQKAIIVFGLATAALLLLGGTISLVTGALTSIVGLVKLLGGMSGVAGAMKTIFAGAGAAAGAGGGIAGTVSALGAALATAGPLALAFAVALFPILGNLGLLAGGFDEARNRAAKWTKETVKAALSTGDAINELKFKRLEAAEAADRAEQKYQKTLDRRQSGDYRIEEDQIVRLRERYYELEARYDGVSGAIERLESQRTKAQKRHTEEVIMAEATAAVYGVEVPKAYQMTTENLKDLQEAIPALIQTFGMTNAQMLLSSGATGSALNAYVKQVLDLTAATTEAWNGQISVMNEFQEQTARTSEEVVASFLKQVEAGMNWANGLVELARAGLDRGILAQLRAAGPESAATVQAILDGVATGSIEILNEAHRRGQEVLAGANTALNELDAIQQAALFRFLSSIDANQKNAIGTTNTNMYAMVDVVSGAVAIIEGQDPTVSVYADDQASAALLHIAELMRQLDGTSASVSAYVQLGGDVAALAGVQRAQLGAVIPGPRSAERLIVAHGGEEIVPAHKRGQGGGDVTVIVVQSMDEAMEHIPAEARTSVQGKMFLYKPPRR